MLEIILNLGDQPNQVEDIYNGRQTLKIKEDSGWYFLFQFQGLKHKCWIPKNIKKLIFHEPATQWLRVRFQNRPNFELWTGHYQNVFKVQSKNNNTPLTEYVIQHNYFNPTYLHTITVDELPNVLLYYLSNLRHIFYWMNN